MDRAKETISPDFVKEAQQDFKELKDNPSKHFLLHGDLHHENVLSSQDSWVAIDPKGVIGEREYEVGAMLRNPYTKLLAKDNPKMVLEKRLEILEDVLGLDKNRMIKWGFAQTVLSVVWNIQSGAGRDKVWVEVAKILREIKKDAS